MATQSIDIDALRTDAEEPFVRSLMIDISEQLCTMGYENSIVDHCTVEKSHEQSDIAAGTGRTATFATGSDNPLVNLLFKNTLPFDLKEMAEQKYENAYLGEGSEHVTTFFNHLGLTVEETINHFDEYGQLEEAKALISVLSDDETNDNDVLAYSIWTYARGWIAEKLISEMDKYSKLWVTNDQAGHDVRENATNVNKQVKCVTHGAQKDDHIYYQWNMNGCLIIGEEFTEVAGKAVENANISKTLTYKCLTGNYSKTDENGNSFRYIWW